MSHWGYGKDNGPSTWVRNFPIAAGTRQSPVSIVRSHATYDAQLHRIPLTIDYTTEMELLLHNTGHTVQCNTIGISEISGGPLHDTYQLEQFHLHWGDGVSGDGSEHTVDGHKYIGEFHLVHWNNGQYSSFSDAVSKSDGLCVIAMLIKVGQEHPGFKTVTDHVHHVKQKDAKHRVYQMFDPTCLLPGNTRDYWTYQGSLTTPPLLESVQWIVMREPVEFSRKQLDSLRQIKDAEGKPIIKNHRPPLSLCGRTVRASFRCLHQRRSVPIIGGASGGQLEEPAYKAITKL